MIVYRYGNRKVYCPETRTYTTATKLLERAKRGEPLTVLCHKTRNNITAEYLLSALARRLYGRAQLDYVLKLVREAA
jgi:polyhydroxyalkanoate synthesis regulator protein